MTQAIRQTYGRSWSPKADVFETEESLILQLDIPGVDPEQVDIQCEKGVLTIKGERLFSADRPKRQYYRIENLYGPFERQFELPHIVNTADVDARYYDGVLTLTFAKKEEVQPRKIAITVAE
jgi:HSP20 family protein